MLKYRCKEYHCPIEFAMDLIGGKWKTRIIWFLSKQTQRFGELERMLPDTSRKVLIQQLRELEMDGIICRKVYAQVPPKVEYSLSEHGRELMPIFNALRSWGTKVVNFLEDKVETS